MPPKTYLVSMEYVRRTLEQHRGRPTTQRSARRFTERKGFPVTYYTSKQIDDLSLPVIWLWERRLVDAFMRYAFRERASK